MKEFEDYHSDVELVKVRPESEHTQSARQANENPFLRKVLKTSSFCKTRDFRDWGKSPKSRQKYPPKHFKSRIWKILLSVFRDLKSYSQESRELSHENLCVPLTTGPTTGEQVAKTDPRAHDSGMRLDLPAIESPKQGNTVFWNFQFLKNKTLSKNT